MVSIDVHSNPSTSVIRQIRINALSLLTTGTAGDVKEYCRKLIEDCAAGGGYILSTGASVDKAPAENIRAMMEGAKEYGVYK